MELAGEGDDDKAIARRALPLGRNHFRGIQGSSWLAENACDDKQWGALGNTPEDHATLVALSTVSTAFLVRDERPLGAVCLPSGSSSG